MADTVTLTELNLILNYIMSALAPSQPYFRFESCRKSGERLVCDRSFGVYKGPVQTSPYRSFQAALRSRTGTRTQDRTDNFTVPVRSY